MAFLSTINRVLICAGLLALVQSGTQLQAAEPSAFPFVYLYQEGDPAYAERRAYTGLKLRERERPLPGAQAAMKEVQILGRALGLRFTLEAIEISEEEKPVGRLRRVMAESAARVFLLDLPLAAVKEISTELAAEDIILFNLRHDDVSLRQEGCTRNLFHTIPSLAMRSDGLAQYLAARRWSRVLILEGEAEADRAFSSAFQVSARKFGLKVVAVHPFVLSNDPRQREQNNISLLTAEPAYDVVFLADDFGEFGRYVPYATHLPRPVVGSEGLVPSAWHWTWERHGAPQLNQRFDKVAGRFMADEDWAAWVAVRVVVEAIARGKVSEVADIRQVIASDTFTFDLYKGNPGNFRSWNNQLRQPILLHTHNATIERAPLPGFLHQHNDLDTLGVDAPESRCRF
jgi:ABC transporter substrate binding protein (PQQ-dependent alcohol dehydrogenase system)